MLIYVADPMCSWCYGFGPQMDTLLERFSEEDLLLVMGGLRAYNTAVMDEDLKGHLRHHWQEVAQRSGLPFNDGLLARDDFVYDTEPACRAVVTARNLSPALARPLLRALQRTFYEQGRDITQAEVLGAVYDDVRRGVGGAPDADAFLSAWDSDEMRAAASKDFVTTQQWGITGFPTVLAIHGEQARLIAVGYTTADAMAERLQSVPDGPTPADRSPAP
jgi:putative protein-disulfide isomerase